MTELRCIIFDVDGTLVDSQNDIVASMERAFAAVGRAAPERQVILSIVGLSLDHAIARLCPEAGPAELSRMIEGYKQTYVALRDASEGAVFFPGMRELLDELAQVPENLLCVATGKSRRGLDALFESAGLTGFFTSEQVSDHHPSKPHPAMIEAVLRETGAEAGRAVMIGDTTFDIEMARAAGVAALGVSWGYHPPEALAGAGARELVSDAATLKAAIHRVTGD